MEWIIASLTHARLHKVLAPRYILYLDDLRTLTVPDQRREIRIVVKGHLEPGDIGRDARCGCWIGIGRNVDDGTCL